jgi:hypothetical protein
VLLFDHEIIPKTPNCDGTTVEATTDFILDDEPEPYEGLYGVPIAQANDARNGKVPRPQGGSAPEKGPFPG